MHITHAQEEVLKSDWQDPSPEKPTRPPSFLLALVRLYFQTFGRIFPALTARYAYHLFTKPRRRARHQSSDPVLESARIFEFLYGRQLLKGYEWGSGERTILLVHGWESRGTALRSFVPVLLEAGFRVLAFDGPAHGDSAGKRTNLPHFAGAVRAAIRQAGAVEGIIAHSFGGASTVYALTQLDPGLSIDKLVYIAVPSSMLRVFENTVRGLRIPKRAAARFKQILEEKAKRPLEELDLSDAYPELNIREALIVHDRFDQIVPFSSARAIAEGWPHARLLVTEGYGHFRLMKNPDLIAQVAGFLAE